jgi:hypothetical protein
MAADLEKADGNNPNEPNDPNDAPKDLLNNT